MAEHYFEQARQILTKAGIAACHIHTKEEWDAADVADAILQELKRGAFTAVIIGQHHHNMLVDLFGRDLAHVVQKHAPHVAVWQIETNDPNQ